MYYIVKKGKSKGEVFIALNEFEEHGVVKVTAQDGTEYTEAEVRLLTKKEQEKYLKVEEIQL